MPADAYFHVYLVNASAKPVHFDNMSIRVIKANTLETMNYYPFGLRWEKHDPESTNNKVWHHGKELQENEFLQQGKSLDLEDFGARMYDPAIGRWWSPDPLAEKFISMTPYCSFGNNPMYFIDPDGREITETDNSFKFTGNDALRLLGFGAPKDPPKKDPAKKNETPLMLQNPSSQKYSPTLPTELFSRNKIIENKGATMYIETDGTGHVYVVVDGIAFSYGRYDGSYSPSSGAYGPVGKGVLMREDLNWVVSRCKKFPTVKFHFSGANSNDILKYLNTIYESGKPSPNNPTGRVVDTYNLLFNNCATLSCLALRSGGVDIPVIAVPNDVISYLKDPIASKYRNNWLNK